MNTRNQKPDNMNTRKQPMSGVERMKKHWTLNVYGKGDQHKKVKELDRIRKSAEYADDWLKRQQNEELVRMNREKKRLKKQKYWVRISKKEKKAEPVTSTKKNVLRRQKRKFEKQIEALQEEVNKLNQKANRTTPKRLKEEPILVSRSSWLHLSPSTKWKTKKKLLESSPRGIGHIFRSILGVNWHLQ